MPMNSPSRSTFAIEADNLVKRFGDFTAVNGVSFAVPEGSVLGLLGPNGAGKTTIVRMLATLSPPTSGSGRIAGYDVEREPDLVRRSMGLTGQAATVDEYLTGRDVLVLKADVGGLRANYLLYSQRTPNPFDMGVLRTFRMPVQL